MGASRGRSVPRRRALLALAGICSLVSAALTAPPSLASATPGFNVRVSVNEFGQGGDGPSVIDGSASADGQVVAFRSDARNLVDDDTNYQRDVFVRDLAAGTTERVSVSSAGAQGTRTSDSPWISADGRDVVFRSDASQMVLGDANNTTDIFIRDLTLDTTEIVSLNDAGAQGVGGTSDCPKISGDGRFVVFSSEATNLAPGDTPGRDMYVRDLQLGTTERVAVDVACSGWISSDGRFVTFESPAPQVIDDHNGYNDIFIVDRQTNTIERVSVDSDEQEANAYSSGPSVSDDGRFVTFTSEGVGPSPSELVPGDTNGWQDVLVRDRQLGTTELVSVDNAGGQGDRWSQGSMISADGSSIAFSSAASNLDPADGSSNTDVFVRDVATDETEWVSRDNSGAPGGGEGPGSRATAGSSSSAVARSSRAETGATPSMSTSTIAMPCRRPTSWLPRSSEPRPAARRRRLVRLTGHDQLGRQRRLRIGHDAAEHARANASRRRRSGRLREPRELRSHGQLGTGVVTLRLDLTDPYVDCLGDPMFARYQAGATVSAGMDDNESGIDSALFPDYRVSQVVSTAAPGSFTVDLTGYDRVGHSTTVSCPYTVSNGIDTNPPTLGTSSLSLSPMSVSESTTLSVRATDAESGVAGGEYFLGADPGEGNGRRWCSRPLC